MVDNKDILERFTELSRRDDCFNYMVPSDVREMLGEIRKLRDSLTTLISYGRWQMLEGKDYHPTLPSAIKEAQDLIPMKTAKDFIK